LQHPAEKEVFWHVLLGFADGLDDVVKALLELVQVGVYQRTDE